MFLEQNIDDVEILAQVDDSQLDFLTENKLGDRIRLKRGIENLRNVSKSI